MKPVLVYKKYIAMCLTYKQGYGPKTLKKLIEEIIEDGEDPDEYLFYEIVGEEKQVKTKITYSVL